MGIVSTAIEIAGGDTGFHGGHVFLLVLFAIVFAVGSGVLIWYGILQRRLRRRD